MLDKINLIVYDYKQFGEVDTLICIRCLQSGVMKLKTIIPDTF